MTCLADSICEFIKPRKEDYSKVLNVLLLNIAISCEKVLITFLIATCICMQTEQRLLHKSTFSCGMVNCFFSSNSATSAHVECLLSTAGKIFRPERCSLKDDTFEKLNMMIKCNYQIKSE